MSGKLPHSLRRLLPTRLVRPLFRISRAIGASKRQIVRWALGLGVAASCFIAASVHAQDQVSPETSARADFERGIEYVDAGRFLDAVVSFRRSLVASDRAVTMFNLANALYRLGRPLEARTVLDAYLRRPDVRDDSSLVREAGTLLALASQAIAHVVVVVDPPEALLQVDDVPRQGAGARREFDLEPGSHVFRTELSGYSNPREVVNFLPGQTLEIRLQAAPVATTVVPAANQDPASPSTVTELDSPETHGARATQLPADQRPASARTIWGWTIFGVGAAAGAGAIVTAALSQSTYSRLENDCEDDICGADDRDDITRGNAFALSSTILAGAAIAGIGTGLVLLWTDPGDESADHPDREARSTLELRPAAVVFTHAF